MTIDVNKPAIAAALKYAVDNVGNSATALIERNRLYCVAVADGDIKPADAEELVKVERTMIARVHPLADLDAAKVSNFRAVLKLGQRAWHATFFANLVGLPLSPDYLRRMAQYFNAKEQKNCPAPTRETLASLLSKFRSDKANTSTRGPSTPKPLTDPVVGMEHIATAVKAFNDAFASKMDASHLSLLQTIERNVATLAPVCVAMRDAENKAKADAAAAAKPPTPAVAPAAPSVDIDAIVAAKVAEALAAQAAQFAALQAAPVVSKANGTTKPKAKAKKRR